MFGTKGKQIIIRVKYLSEVDFMEIKDFIGKIVIRTSDKKRLFITGITAPKIDAKTVDPEAHGYHACYRWETINGDPITNGYLIFEDESLTEQFKKTYDAYCRTKDAYWENYGYYMSKS